MAKKAPKRRLNRKAKRTIRRSIAALLMVTAIGVAAIPVPDAVAETTTTSATTEANRSKITADSAADNARDACVYTPGADLSLDPTGFLSVGSNQTYSSYTIQQLSNGRYELNWQFKYYLQMVNGTQKAIISEYNNLYQETNVTLSNNATTKYYTVTTNDYDVFYATGAGSTAHMIQYSDYESYMTSQVFTAEETWFQTYRSADFDSFWNLCKTYYDATAEYNQKVSDYNVALTKYNADYQAWEDGGRVGAAPVAPTPVAGITLPKPDKITCTPSNDFTETEKYSYYCQNDAELNKIGSGFTLESVIDSAASTGATAQYIYVAKNGGNAAITGNGASLDANGFLITETSVGICGIGNKAFSNVKNVDYLYIPQEIKYIGDEAFMGSFIKSIEFANVENIGNRAFKNCTQLTSANLGSATIKIGKEAFYNTGLSSIAFQYSVEEIGPGAFAECKLLGNVSLAAVSNCKVAEYAFYNCYVLNAVNMSGTCGVHTIGDGAFAVSSGVTGSWTAAELPKACSATDSLGNWLFAGRTTLKSVVFPGDYGLTSANAVKVPSGMFKGCANMDYVEFPDAGNNSCGYVTFEPYLFLDVINDAFYVKGPERNSAGDNAGPRTSTWKAITAVSNFIPYVYTNSVGVECYEVSDGTYLLQANENGELTSCTLVDEDATSVDLVIPSYVGNYKINSVSTDCFSDEALRGKIASITVADDSITTIAASAFEGLPNLKWIKIGNSVANLGDRAFANCDKLESVSIGRGMTAIGNSVFEGCEALVDVTFETPNGGYENYTIGTDAFKTGSTKLLFHGDIIKGFQPFDWAMEPSNVIDDFGTRVCYQSLSPSYLTVMYDYSTGDITLLDYPKYNQLDIDHAAHNDAMETYYYNLYTTYTDYQNNFKNVWVNATSAEEAYASEWYGPWVNSAFCATSGSWNVAPSPSGKIDILDIFMPVMEVQALGTTPEPYFTTFPYSIIENYERGSNSVGVYQNTTTEEEAWIAGTLNINVPEGVTSIDVKGFIDGSSANSRNVNTYLNGSAGIDMYKTGTLDNDNNMSIPGLFSGTYKDYKNDSDNEVNIRGNDYVQTISLSSVKKLPEYAFDSCERLQSVILGTECNDIGTAPFRGCTTLTTVGSNDFYKYNNGILYSINPDESLTIEECLATRGDLIGQSVVNATNDPDITNVSSIKEGAFEDCDKVATVDFSTATKLTTIPEDCFTNCDFLSYVTLPESVTRIEDNAFKDDDRLNITIPGKEVYMASSALPHQPTVNVRTYKDSAALEYAKYYGLSYELIEDNYRVIFMDNDGTMIGEPQYVKEGGNAVPPEDPVKEGLTFKGWSGEYTNIKADTVLIAQYETTGSGGNTPGGNTPGGNTPGGNTPGGTTPGGNTPSGNNPGGSTLYSVTVVNGSGGGSYAAGSTVIIVANNPPSGQVFSRWTTDDGITLASNRVSATTFTMPAKAVTVTATYTSGSGSSTVSGNSSTNTNKRPTGTQVTINRPGISNSDLASATVNGSTDNFIVKITESATATAEVEKALTNEYGSLDAIKYFAMDISLYDSTGNTKIANTAGITVDITIPLPDSLTSYAGNNKVAGVVNEKLDKLSPRFSTIDGVPCVTFRATHFSPYTVYVDTNNLTAGTLDATPQTGDGIHPKWFLAIGLACLSVILFIKRDKVERRPKARLA